MMDSKSSNYNTYLNGIGRVPLLTPEQEITLGRQVQRAEALKALGRELTDHEKRIVRVGERATRRFINSNLRLVVNAAKKYSRIAKSMDLMDLIQEGNIGLFTAAQRFDPSMGYKFSTYAYWWIRQGIMRSIQYKDRMMRLPGSIGCMAYSWSSKCEALRNELGRQPTREELAKTFKVTPEDLDLFLERGAHVGTLDRTVLDGSGCTLKDMIADPLDEDGTEAMEQMLLNEQLDSLETALHSLTEREREIVTRRYGLYGSRTHSLNEIGKELGISRERVRQLLDISYRKIRSNFRKRENLSEAEEHCLRMVGVGAPIP